jgi:DsbC/DsbD-like thiol-disulfide interchange protein/cytochrome c biogenesis protein CcdA
MRASTFRIFEALIVALALAFASLAAAQAPAGKNHIAAELVAEGPAVPGETLQLAIHFTPEPGWHGYWSNPGDAGYGMRLTWQVPEGWAAGAPQYPVPHRLTIAGLMNHVYEGDYAVLVPLSVPPQAAVQNIVPLELKAEWLACTDQVCVPESATFTLRLGQAMARDARFDTWRAALPPPLDRKAMFELAGDRLRLAIPLPASFALRDPHVFLGEERVVDYAAPQRFFRKGDLLIAEITRKGGGEPGAVSGIIALDGAANGIAFEANPGPVPTGGEPVGGGAAPDTSLWLLLGGALLGGLLLNIMPCVFPILSLKALSLARAGESEAQARREGLAYTAGVMLAVVALGALLLALRAGGEEIGWAFQLQEPGVVVALLVLAVAITANFAGLFELPSLSFSGSGKAPGAFATGLLAAFVATPCTGPFMAAAMGAALLLPTALALLLFAALGLGLALPFLLLGFVPPLRRLLPKPGKWMDTFRKIMAVPMGLTALALLWLAWRLGGTAFAATALAVSLAALVALVAWRRGLTLVAVAGAVAIVAGAVTLPMIARSGETTAEAGLIAAKPFTEAALAEARESGKPVFVWFTADWCLTCKVNEGVAIEREATRDAFKQAGVVALVGDWTRRDPAISRFLTQQGAAGVPLYLWYAPGGEARQLPQVLTPDSLVTLAEESRAKQSGPAKAPPASPAAGTTRPVDAAAGSAGA